MVRQETDGRSNRDGIISSRENLLSLEELVQRSEEIREGLLLSRKEAPATPKISGEIILSETPEGEIDLRALVEAGERRKREQLQREDDLANLYTQSHSLMEKVSRRIGAEWGIIRNAETLLTEGYIPDRGGVRGAIIVKTEELKIAWQKAFFPPRVFYKAAPASRSQFFDFGAGELIAVICVPSPTEGFAFENHQEIVRWGMKREFERDLEAQRRARGYVKATKLSFTTLLRKRTRENLGQTINHFLETEKKGGPLHWQLKILEAMAPWQVEIGGEAFVYGQLTVKQFIEGVLNRFFRPRLDWKSVETPGRKGKEPAIFRRRFSPQAHDILARIVSFNPSVPLNDEKEAFNFSRRSKEWAERRLREMKAKGRKITEEDLNSLVGQLAVMANAAEADLKEFIRRRVSYPILAELATHCSNLRSPGEKAGFLKAIFAARPLDLIQEGVGKPERVELCDSGQVDKQIRLLLQEIAERQGARMKGVELRPSSLFTIFQAEEIFPSLDLATQREIVDGYRLVTLEGTDNHPLYPLATFLQILIAKKFKGIQAKGVLRKILKGITDEYVARVFPSSQ